MDVTKTIVMILAFSTLIEFLVDIVKGILGTKAMEYIKSPTLALIFGVLFAFAFRLDIFAMLGVTAIIPWVSQLVTGLVLSAGSKPLHEFLAKLQQTRKNDQQLLDFYYDMVPNETLEQRTASKVYARHGSAAESPVTEHE